MNASEAILCNADGSMVNNVTVTGVPGIENNGFIISRTDNAVIAKLHSDTPASGFHDRL